MASTTDENVEQPEENLQIQVENVPENSENVVSEPPKRKGGRPLGSKDAKPRKKPQRIIEEPLVQEVQAPRALPKAHIEPTPAPIEPLPPSPPPSPSSMLRTARAMIMEAHNGRNNSRRKYFQDSVQRCTHEFNW